MTRKWIWLILWSSISCTCSRIKDRAELPFLMRTIIPNIWSKKMWNSHGMETKQKASADTRKNTNGKKMIKFIENFGGKSWKSAKYLSVIRKKNGHHLNASDFFVSQTVRAWQDFDWKRFIIVTALAFNHFCSESSIIHSSAIRNFQFPIISVEKKQKIDPAWIRTHYLLFRCQLWSLWQRSFYSTHRSMFWLLRVWLRQSRMTCVWHQAPP